MGSEIPDLDYDWDYPLTEEDLQAIDSVFSSVAASAPPPKRHVLSSCGGDAASVELEPPPKMRRRLPETLFAFQKQQNNKWNGSLSLSACPRGRFRSYGNKSDISSFLELKFGGRVIYSRTVEEVERAAEELLDFVEAKKRKEGQCILGLDIEWTPSFRRGVSPGKAAVMQICGHNTCCHVIHIIHSGITEKLQTLLEDCSSLKVGLGIAGDATKVRKDHNVSIKSLADLSDLANKKLGGDPKKWSMSSLVEKIICKELPKPNRIRLSNWEVDVLSKEQLQYAAADAYISWYLYEVLRNYPDPAGNISEEVAPK